METRLLVMDASNVLLNGVIPAQILMELTKLKSVFLYAVITMWLEMKHVMMETQQIVKVVLQIAKELCRVGNALS